MDRRLRYRLNKEKKAKAQEPDSGSKIGKGMPGEKVFSDILPDE